MNSMLLSLLLVLSAIVMHAQEQCFEDLRSEGIHFLQKRNYRQAIDKFIAARFCPDKPELDDLDYLIKKSQNKWVWELDHALQTVRSAERKNRVLVAQSDTLRYYLRGDSTYEVYLNSGIMKFRQGAYQEALYDFAIARFTKENKLVLQWISQCQLGLQAEQLVALGRLFSAETLFKSINSLDSLDHREQRLKQLKTTQEKWNATIKNRNLKNLDTLYLIYDLNFIPAELAHLKALRALFLVENDLGLLPSESWQILQKLPNLQALDLSGNELWKLSIAAWKELGNIDSLQALVLSDNHLAQLPPTHWEALPQLTQLKMLDLSRNALQLLPTILNQMTNLETLLLVENQLPFEFHHWDFLKKLPHLHLLDVRLNKLPPDTILYIRSIVPPACQVVVD